MDDRRDAGVLESTPEQVRLQRIRSRAGDFEVAWILGFLGGIVVGIAVARVQEVGHFVLTDSAAAPLRQASAAGVRRREIEIKLPQVAFAYDAVSAGAVRGIDDLDLGDVSLPRQLAHLDLSLRQRGTEEHLAA